MFVNHTATRLYVTSGIDIPIILSEPKRQVMLGGGHINADMQQFLEKDKKAGNMGWNICWPHKLDSDMYIYDVCITRTCVYVYMCKIQYIICTCVKFNTLYVHV